MFYLFKCVLTSRHVPAWYWVKTPTLQLIHVWDRHPAQSLSCPPSRTPLLLIGCLDTRIKYRPALSKLSILTIQRLSVFSNMLCPLPTPPLLPASLSPSFCQFVLVGTLGISDEEMENIPQTVRAALVKCDFHNESLDDQVKESVGWLCVHPRNMQGPRSALCSFIQLADLPLCYEAALIFTFKVLPFIFPY